MDDFDDLEAMAKAVSVKSYAPKATAVFIMNRVDDDSSHETKLSLSAEALSVDDVKSSHAEPTSINAKGLNPASPDVNQVDIDDCSTHDTKPSMTTEPVVLSIASNTDDDGRSLNISTQQMSLAVQECSAPSTDFVMNYVDVNDCHRQDTTTSFPPGPFPFRWAVSVVHRTPKTEVDRHGFDISVQKMSPAIYELCRRW